MVATYTARVRALHHSCLDAQEETMKMPSRRRRAPLGFVGSLSKSIFGTATTKDVEKVRDKVNGLISALQERDLVVSAMPLRWTNLWNTPGKNHAATTGRG